MFRSATLFVCLAALLLLAGCPGQQQAPPGGQAPATPIGGGPDIPTLEPGCLVKTGLERDLCLKQEALDSDDKGRCYLILDNYVRQDCIYPFALREPELCSDLDGQLADECYYNSARLTGAKTECGKISDEGMRQECAGPFERQCDGVSDAGWNRTLCEAEAARDVSKCLDGAYAEECAFDYALKFKSRGACDRIGDATVRYACLGVLSDDQAYCDSTNVTESRDRCRTIVARELGDSGICAGVTGGTVGQYKYSTQGTESYVVQCYAEVGIRLRNYTVCEQLQSGINRDGCYDAVARGALIPKACGKIFTKVDLDGTAQITFKHDGCYRDVAKALGDPSVCNYIVSTGTKDRYCYLQIIYGRDAENGYAYNYTLEMCTGIEDTNRKWTCVSEYAKRAQDSSLCVLIPDDMQFGPTRNACLDGAGEGKRTDYKKCEAFQQGQAMDGCYRDVAKNTEEPSVCNYIEDNITRDIYCYLEIMQGTNPATGKKYGLTLDKCGLISYEEMKWTCVSEVANRENDLSLCNTIPQNATRTVTTEAYTRSIAIRNECLGTAGI